jgi:thioredoxin reductase
MKYDLAIIGCGSVGAAAGYYAAMSGLNVLMLDSHTRPIVMVAIMVILVLSVTPMVKVRNTFH